MKFPFYQLCFSQSLLSFFFCVGLIKCKIECRPRYTVYGCWWVSSWQELVRTWEHVLHGRQSVKNTWDTTSRPRTTPGENIYPCKLQTVQTQLWRTNTFLEAFVTLGRHVIYQSICLLDNRHGVVLFLFAENCKDDRLCMNTWTKPLQKDNCAHACVQNSCNHSDHTAHILYEGMVSGIQVEVGQLEGTSTLPAIKMI